MRGETERQDVRHQWRRDNQDQHSAHETRHLTSECARSLLVSFVQSCVVIITHCTPHRVAQVVRVFALISSMHEVSVTLRLWALHSIQLPLFFYSSSISRSSCCQSLLLRELVVTLCTPPTRRWTLLTNPTHTQVMSPMISTSWRLMSSPSQSPWPSNSSPSNGSSRMWITMTPRSRRCFITHTEYMSVTPSEKACLLVSRRCPCPSERGDLLENERGDLLDQLVRS